jgi:hypothetical protein
MVAATAWPTVDVDAIDMGRAADQLVDGLGCDRCVDLVAALVERCWPGRAATVVDRLELCEDCSYVAEELTGP